MADIRPFDPLGALESLLRHHVRFVIIGGFAARLLGGTVMTDDLDICYERSHENLEKLAEALRDLEARLRGVDEEVPFILDAETLERGDHFTFLTSSGGLDCLGTPSGSEGYDDLLRNASPLDLNGVIVDVASIDDLIAMKEASDRPKDRYHLEVLGALRDEIDRQGR